MIIKQKTVTISCALFLVQQSTPQLIMSIGNIYVLRRGGYNHEGEHHLNTTNILILRDYEYFSILLLMVIQQKCTVTVALQQHCNIYYSIYVVDVEGSPSGNPSLSIFVRTE